MAVVWLLVVVRPPFCERMYKTESGSRNEVRWVDKYYRHLLYGPSNSSLATQITESVSTDSRLLAFSIAFSFNSKLSRHPSICICSYLLLGQKTTGWLSGSIIGDPESTCPIRQIISPIIEENACRAKVSSMISREKHLPRTSQTHRCLC
jgi:hypothetical protein